VKYLTLEKVLHCIWGLMATVLLGLGSWLLTSVIANKTALAEMEVRVEKEEKALEKHFKILQEQLDRRFTAIDHRLDRIETKLENR